MKNYIKLFAVVMVLTLVTVDIASASTGYGGGGSRRAVSTSPVSNTVNRGQVLGASTYAFNSDVKLGHATNDVKELQEKLRTLGFFTFQTSTGYFGPITLAAVKAFQTANGIPATGFVGPLTRAALNK